MKVDKVIVVGIVIIAVLVVILILAGACGACFLFASIPGMHTTTGQTEQQTRTDTHAGADSIELVVSTVGGNVDIREWSQDTVQVTYQVTAPSGHLDDVLTSTKDTKGDNSTRITAEVKFRDESLFTMGRYSADVVVMVPEGSTYSLDLHTLSGEINVAPLQGSSVYMNTLSGGLYLNGGRYDTVYMDTLSGNVHATYESANATLITLSGNINVETTQTTGTLNADTMSGNIDVALPSETLFTVDASTASGRIRHGSIQMTTTTEKDTRLVGQTEAGPGSLAIKLKTMSGNINIGY